MDRQLDHETNRQLVMDGKVIAGGAGRVVSHTRNGHVALV